MTEMEILQTTTDPIEMDMGDPVIEYSPVYPNPEGDPTDDLTKVQIQGDIYKVKDPEVHDWARAEEKPTYTKAEVGLGNVDNTSDMDKPVSTATQTALDNKVDKVAGKGLSEEDFTHTLKNKLDGIEAGAEVNTVNSVAGKTGDITLDKSDVGLGNVDNTSDMSKPVSTATQEALQGLASATQTALNGKVDNSTLNNYYTKIETDTALGNKVDKVQGKGLSSNDYTDTEKALVGTIEDKLDKTENAIRSDALAIISPVTDTAPYIYRQTPVKESFKALMKKIVGASVVWNQLVKNGNFASTSNWGTKPSITFTVANNIGTITTSTEASDIFIAQGFEFNINHKYILHAEYMSSAVNNENLFVAYWGGSNDRLIKKATSTNTWESISTIFNCVSNQYNFIRLYVTKTDVTNKFKNIYCIDLTAMFGTTIADYVYTLETAEAGTGIAWLQSYGFFTEDYYAYKQNKLESGCVSAKKTYGKNLCVEVIDNALSMSGSSRVVVFGTGTTAFIECKKGYTYTVSGAIGRNRAIVGYFDDIPSLNEISVYDNSTESNGQIFNANTTGYSFTAQYSGYAGIYLANAILENVNIQVEIGTTATDYVPYVEPTTYPISPITLRGLFKLSTDKLTVDGDEYNADGSVTRKYEQRAYQSGDESLANAITDGTNTIVKLATPTTEQTTPFTETEIVGSTEEFIDYEVAQDNRDVAIPVGTETDYYQEMKLPSLPTTSGNHNLIYNVETGFGWS